MAEETPTSHEHWPYHAEPSLGQQVNKVLERHDGQLEQINLLRKIVGFYMKRDGLTQAKYSWKELLESDPASVGPDGAGGSIATLES